MANRLRRDDHLDSVVVIVNDGDKSFVDRYDGRVYVITPKSKIRVTYAKAALWFGDPKLRNEVKSWNEEVRRVQCRHGWISYNEMSERWRYLLDGHIYVRQFGRGKPFYSAKTAPEKDAVYSTPLTETDIDDDAGELELDDLLADDDGPRDDAGDSSLPALPSLPGLSDDDVIVAGEMPPGLPANPKLKSRK